MRWGFDFMQQPEGHSIYLRLSTRSLDQPERVLSDAERRAVIDGAYWRTPPGEGARLVVVYCGAVAPEAWEAFQQILEDDPQAGLLAVTSPDRLHRDWSAALRAQAQGQSARSPIENIIECVPRHARLVTLMDGPPATLSWLGSVCGHRLVPLGFDRFGQSGDLIDLYREYRLDSAAVVEAAATVLLEGERA
jgi:pyruvate dehydrogenase E1 component